MGNVPVGFDRNVYILGAGFSREAGMPLMAEFRQEAEHARDWLDSSGRQQEARFVETLLELWAQATKATFRIKLDINNIEELFSLVSASGDRRSETSCTHAIAAVLDYAERTKDELCCIVRLPRGTAPLKSWQLLPTTSSRQRDYMCSVYDYYASLFGKGINAGMSAETDTIISLNYDLLLEQAFGRLGIPFNFGLPRKDIVFEPSAEWLEHQYQQSGLQILKLHGSLNWVSPFEKPTLLPLPNDALGKQLDSAAVYSTAIHVYGSYRDVLKKKKTPLLVPPTWRKSFSLKLGKIWEQALTAIKQANRIVIVGYSMPETDLHMKYLLAAGLMENKGLQTILFVNPDRKLRRKVREIFWSHSNPAVGPRIEFVPQRTAHFFLDPTCSRKIGRSRPYPKASLRVIQKA
jgi:hypothetical protein